MLEQSNFSFPVKQEDVIGLDRICHAQKYRAGQVIFAKDDQNDFVVLVVQGVAKLQKLLPDGRHQIVGLLFPGDFFTSLSNERSHSIAEALNEMEIRFFSLAAFRNTVEHLPKFQSDLLVQTTNELDISREWMLLLGQKTALEKVATFLSKISTKHGRSVAYVDSPNGQAITVQLPLSRTDLGDFLGLTPETVSRQISLLKSEHVIHLSDKRTIWVLDMQRLAKFGTLSEIAP